MIDYSAKDIFEMGDKTACEKLPKDEAHFAVIDFYMQTMPSIFK